MQGNTPQYRKLLIKNLANPDGSKLKPPKGKTATIQPRSQGSLLPVGRVGENPGNEVALLVEKLRIQSKPVQAHPFNSDTSLLPTVIFVP